MTKYSVSELISILDKADNHYYRVGMTPIMSDEQYDSYKQMLRNMNPDHPRLNQVGLLYNVDDLRTKVKHSVPMGSLDNTDDGIIGYSDWIQGLKNKVGGDTPIMASLKIDGASICATYKAGVLQKVVTRGNGEYGDDITINGANFKDLPTRLNQDIDVDIRGEAILYKADFEAICKRECIAADQISNPRNVGNGILGRDDGKDSDLIRFIAFNIFCDIELPTEAAKYALLKKLGFKPVPHSLCDTIEDFNNFYNNVASYRDKLPFEIDGIVVCLDECDQQANFVTEDIKTKLRPKYARAVKFPHKSAITTLLDVTNSVGHTRAIVPTALLEEVRVGGVYVKHALLNNYEEIKRLGIAINDRVEVILAGDIIPKVIRLVEKSSDRKQINEPSQCPTCGSNTTRIVRGKPGAVTYCANVQCGSSKIAKIDHWVGTSRTGVGILGIGDGTLMAMWDSGLVKDPADLYTLKPDDLKDLELEGQVKIGLSRAKMIVENINSKRKLDLPTFIGSLGIELLGRRRVKLLIEQAQGRLNTIHQWMDEVNVHSLEVAGMGDAVKSAIINGIKANRDLINKLLNNGVVIDGDDVRDVQEAPEQALEDKKPFSGMSFCLTGTRAYMKEIEALGGQIKSGVSKDLTFLVQADPLSVSSKTQKAESYGIPIISVEYLEKAIKGEVKLDVDVMQ